MNKKVSELDSTKARLRLLEQTIAHKEGKHQSESTNENPASAISSGTNHKSENHRVHFDLNNATTNQEIRKPARTSRSNGGSGVTRPNSVHLQNSDARQKIEQLVSIFSFLTECRFTKIVLRD